MKRTHSKLWATQPEQNLIWCGPDNPPRGSRQQYGRIIKLDTYPGEVNAHLKFETISAKPACDLPSIAWYMLEVGMCVYCADQTIKRGGDTGRGNGKDWYRNFVFEIPHDTYFVFDESQPWFDADEVLLFFGGLDSLAGAIEEVVNLKKKVVLVSHRPVAKISKRQRDLLEHLRHLAHAHGRWV